MSSGSSLRRTDLLGGLRVVTEQVVGVRSASIGVWVGVGSRHETPALHGCSHFLEHLLFKGTRYRSALDISHELDAVGGEANAFTTKEYTCFHTRVLDRDLPSAIDVLGDMITDPLIAPLDVEAERAVILDEIAMYDDDPDDVVQNLAAGLAWGNTPLGRPIAGTRESIAAITREQVVRFHRRHYRPDNIVVAAAGNLDHDDVVRQVERAFDRAGFAARAAASPGRAPSGRLRRVRPGVQVDSRPFEQVSLVLGVNGPPRNDEGRFALGLLNTVLGGGTSSRLFQAVREERGLAYSIHSFASHYADAGMVGVACACLPDRYDEVLEVTRAELARVAESGISVEELARGKAQLQGALVLGLEDTVSRMVRLGKSELVADRLLDLDEVMDRIDGVGLAEVHSLARRLFSQPQVLAVVGPTP
ncbi:M16 family metallopeptidase [Nocardioides limicola]|uniref:M16 family metallopeptidase n=1 Tax=Nocardioides limicola TaxID=2803368 RepID=UPI00193C0337|nr:pitrilysin family protein [Nocardioides sp. DJM-14]